MKILIIDRDFNNVIKIKDSIKKTKPYIKSYYSISDPEIDPLKNVDKHNIDLIFIDIHFYGIKTKGIIQSINEKYKEVKFIFIGTYLDQPYFDVFMEYNGITYMTRPIQTKVIQDAVQLAEDIQLKEENELLEKNIIKEKAINNKALFKQLFLSNLCAGNITSKSELERTKKYFNITLNDDYRVFIVRIDKYQKIILTLDEIDKHILIYNLQNIINNVMTKYNHTSFFDTLNELNIISNGLEDIGETLILCDDIRFNVFKELGLRVTIGVGRHYTDISEVAVSYNESKTALNYRFAMGYSSVTPIELVEPNNTVTARLNKQKKNKLIHNIVVGQKEIAQNTLTDLLKPLYEYNVNDSKYISKLVFNIFGNIDWIASVQGFNTDILYTKCASITDILNIQSLEEAENILRRTIDVFCSYISSERDKNNKELYEKLVDYANDHYLEKITYTDIAKTFKTSIDYINKLFLEHNNLNFVQYINSKKIEKSKQLMAEGIYTDEEIAIKVGYSNKKYFCSMFKQITGMTTIEYRSLSKF